MKHSRKCHKTVRLDKMTPAKADVLKVLEAILEFLGYTKKQSTRKRPTLSMRRKS